MQPDFDSAIFFAAKSEAVLEEVCETIRSRYDLPPFFFDWEDSWHYGFSYSEKFCVNVTKTEGFDTIFTWTPDAPKDVNFQVVYLYWEKDDICTDFEKFREELVEVLGSPVARYWQR